MSRAVRRYSVGYGLRAILVFQLVVAGLLIFTDVSESISNPWQERVDLPTGPVSPGDQRRTYRYDETRPDYVTTQTPVVLPIPESMPERLRFDVLDVEDYGFVISMTGEIVDGDLFRLQSFLDGLEKQPDLIALNSPGGSVYEALGIGRLLRAGEFKVSVLSGSICLSACPYVLAGGTDRLVSRNAAIGMHQHYFDTPKLLPAFIAVKDIQIGQGKTMEYLIEMGVDASIMLFSLKTPPEEIYLLVEDELDRTNLATKMLD